MIRNIFCGELVLNESNAKEDRLANTIHKYLQTSSYKIHSNLMNLDSMETIGLLATIESENNIEINLDEFNGDMHLTSIEELTKYILNNSVDI